MKSSILLVSCSIVARVLSVQYGLDNASARNSPVKTLSIASNGTALLAPIYRSGSVGQAWVFPSSAFDLGARSMGCECFNPDNSCCMPVSNNLSPFCMPINSTCCGNSYCIEGESCCGDFCCAAGTTCNVKDAGSGCCPKEKVCNSPPTCHNHDSLDCIGPAAKKDCCPTDAPYCQDSSPSGMGCHASSTPKTTSSSGSVSSIPAPLPPTTHTLPLTTKTITVSVIPNSQGLSLEFPPVSSPASVSIDYVLDWPTTSSLGSLNAIIPPPTNTPSISSIIETDTSSAPKSSKASALCFNEKLQTPTTCPSTTAASNPSSKTTSSSSTETPLYSPAGSTIYKSQAHKLTPFASIFEHPTTNHNKDPRKPSHTAWILLSPLALCTGLAYCFHLSNDSTPSVTSTKKIRPDDIYLIPKSGRALSAVSYLGREITPIMATARPYKEPFVVDKARIHVVEGSAVPLMGNEGLGLTLLGLKGDA